MSELEIWEQLAKNLAKELCTETSKHNETKKVKAELMVEMHKMKRKLDELDFILQEVRKVVKE